MDIDISKKVHHLLDLKMSNSSFTLGSINLCENHDIVIEVMQSYYKHIKAIHNNFEEYNKQISYEESDSSLYLKLFIKKRDYLVLSLM